MLEADTMAILFRNTRELLVNIFKHAHASEISLRMHWTADKLEIIVDIVQLERKQQDAINE